MLAMITACSWHLPGYACSITRRAIHCVLEESGIWVMPSRLAPGRDNGDKQINPDMWWVSLGPINRHWPR